jgi:hypothetical protein
MGHPKIVTQVQRVITLRFAGKTGAASFKLTWWFRYRKLEQVEGCSLELTSLV